MVVNMQIAVRSGLWYILAEIFYSFLPLNPPPAGGDFLLYLRPKLLLGTE
jgi:hypothetical protein